MKTQFKGSRLAIPAGVVILLSTLLAIAITKQKHCDIDFPSYYFGAYAYTSGVNPYDFRSLLTNVPSKLLDHELFPYLYTPPCTILFIPFISLPYKLAQGIWSALNLCFLGASICLMATSLRTNGVKHSFQMVFCATLVLSFPIIHTIYNGQINLLTLTSICLGFWALSKRNNSLSLWAFTAGALLKITPMAFLVFSLRGYKSSVMNLVIRWVAPLGVLIYSQLSFWQLYLQRMSTLGYSKDVGAHTQASSSANVGIMRLVARLTSHSQFESKLLAGTIALSLLAVILKQRKYLWKQPLEVLVLTLFCLNISPIAWSHHFVLLMPGLAMYFASIHRLECLNRSTIFLIASLIFATLPWGTLATRSAVCEDMASITPFVFFGSILYLSLIEAPRFFKLSTP